MPRISAGLLMYRIKDGLEVLLAHPGGPYFVNYKGSSRSSPRSTGPSGSGLATARKKIKAGQEGLIDELELLLKNMSQEFPEERRVRLLPILRSGAIVQVAGQPRGRADTPGFTARSIGNMGSRWPRLAYRPSLHKS